MNKGATKEKVERINLGIAIARATLKPGYTRTTQEIADYCDCSKTAIQLIELAALKKLRKRLGPYYIQYST